MQRFLLVLCTLAPFSYAALAQVPASQPTSQPTAASLSGSPPKELNLDLGNNAQLKLVLIPAGEFLMGSPDNEPEAKPDEHPRRLVRITRPFYMGATELTQAQWTAVMGTTIRDVQAKLTKTKWPLRGEGPDIPMYLVRWDEAVDYCTKLSAKIGRTVRLPTEAEWEYACRAGTKTAYYWGDDWGQMDAYAWTRGNSRSVNEAYPVARKKPNAWGLYDMVGNIWEWCHDFYDKDYNAKGEDVDPKGPATGKKHSLRSGAWFSYGHPRSARRQADNQEDRWGWGVGFRVVVETTGKPVAQ
jgi:formylglycine-generating enzyme required for sulfatase activity